MPALSNLRMSLYGDLDSFKKVSMDCSPKTLYTTFVSAIHNGHLDCVKYMAENGYVDISSKAYCDIAAKRGHLDCLMYLHQKGCSFSKYTALIAMIREDYSCLSYILQNGGQLEVPPM